MEQEGVRTSEEKAAFLAALCLFLATVEYAIPKPLPILRLGLANLPVLAALSCLDGRVFFHLVFLKFLTQALVSGTLFSYVALFSAAGSLASGAVMFGVHRVFRGPLAPSLVGLSVAGSLANNLAQLALGRVLLFGEGTRFIAPVVLSVGAVTGVVLGVAAEAFAAQSEWLKRMREGGGKTRAAMAKRGSVQVNAGNPAANVGFLPMLGIPLFLCIRDVTLLAVVVILAGAAVKILRGKVRVVNALCVTMGVVFFALLVPNGKVFATIGPLFITEGALVSGLRRAEILVGMVFLSQLILGGARMSDNRLLKASLFPLVLMYYNAVISKKVTFEKGNILKSLDKLLLSIEVPS